MTGRTGPLNYLTGGAAAFDNALSPQQTSVNNWLNHRAMNRVYSRPDVGSDNDMALRYGVPADELSFMARMLGTPQEALDPQTGQAIPLDDPYHPGFRPVDPRDLGMMFRGAAPNSLDQLRDYYHSSPRRR